MTGRVATREPTIMQLNASGAAQNPVRPPHAQTTSRPRNGGHSWSVVVTDGLTETVADLGKPRNHSVPPIRARTFTRQRPLVRNQYRPLRRIPWSWGRV